MQKIIKMISLPIVVVKSFYTQKIKFNIRSLKKNLAIL